MGTDIRQRYLGTEGEPWGNHVAMVDMRKLGWIKNGRSPFWRNQSRFRATWNWMISRVLIINDQPNFESSDSVLEMFHFFKKTPNLDQAWRALHLKIDPNLIFRPPWPLSVRRALRQDAEAAEGILCTRLMAHTCKRLFPCGHPIYRFVDLMSRCSGRIISMPGEPYWYLPSYVCFTNHMVLMRNLQTHAQLFPISARNTQSCKVSHWRLTAVQEMASF